MKLISQEELNKLPQTFDFIDYLQARVAMLAIGRSTLRKQGAAGMVGVARKFLRGVKLQEFSGLTRQQFASTLETQTTLLAKNFPNGGKGNWGAARKSLNIFLRDVAYCRLLCKHYKLASIEPWLELPLDSNSYKGLLSDITNPDEVSNWPGVKALTPNVSTELQDIATSVAKYFGVPRVHLDVRYWRRGLIDEL